MDALMISRACLTCFRAKVKCVFGEPLNGKCQRCHRLNKDCEPQQDRPQPRKRKVDSEARKSSNPQANNEKLDKLEQKLDGLVMLLKSSKESDADSGKQSISMESISPRPEEEELRPRLGVHDMAELESRTQHSIYNFQSEASKVEAEIAPESVDSTKLQPKSTSGNVQVHQQATWPMIQAFEFESLDKTILLNKFRTEFYPKFPFVVVPLNTTPEELRQQRPFLYDTIIALTCWNTETQKILGKSIMRQLGERVYANGERNMDLLLGALSYAGWCYHNFWSIPQLTSLLSAIATLACDLGLTRPPKTLTSRSLIEDAIRESSQGTSGYMSHSRNSRTREEYRTFLGCYFLSSAASTFFRRIDNLMPYSRYVETSRQALETSGDQPCDGLAVLLVSLQVIIEKIHQSPWHNKFETITSPIPIPFIVNAHKESLSQFRSNIPTDQESNPLILIQFYMAEFMVNEASLSKIHYPTSSGEVDLLRLELLWACVQSSKSFFEIFMSIPVEDYPSLSVPTWSHFTYALIMLHVLSIFECPGWSTEYVKTTHDFWTLMDRCIERWSSVTSADGNDIFSRSAKRMRHVKAYIQGRRYGGGTASNSCQRDDYKDPSSQELPADVDILRASEEFDFMQFVDGDWLHDILQPWDYQFTGGNDIN